VEEIGADVSTVSKHLTIMRQAGLLSDRKEGNRVLYTLRCPCIMQFIHCIDDVVLQEAERGFACVLPQASMVSTAAAATEES